jgi:hypothetical protein
MENFYRGNPETQLFRRRETSGNEDFDTQVVAKYRKRRPNETSFIGKNGYTQAEVEADLEDIRGKQETIFSKEGEGATQMFYGTMEGIAQHGWLGESTENRTIEVVQTSRFDDVKNGVDFTVVIQEKGRPPIVIGIDATSMEDPYKLEQKLMRSINGVKHGQLAPLKYYRYKGAVAPKGYTVPRGVLGANAENAKRIASSMVDATAKENPVQHALLQELEGQFRAQLAEAIAAYHRHGESTLEEPNVLGQLEAWEEALPESVEDSGINTTEAATFGELLEKVRSSFGEGTNVYGKNLKRLAEVVGYIARVRMEKSASVSQDAFKDDRTVQALTHPRRVA